MTKISYSDISIIVQGPVVKVETAQSLKSIRKFLPGATIILSTWEGSDVTELDYDKLILSKDPGSFICDKVGAIHTNINRQLLSIKNGLEAVNTKYAMKLRSDLVMHHAKFLDYFDAFPQRIEKYKLLEHRIISGSLTTKIFSDTDNNYPLPFCLSDWFYFGLTSDIRTFFAATPLIEDEAAFSQYKLKFPDRKPGEHLNFRFAPEQYFCYSAFKRKFDDIEFDDWSDFNEKNIKQSELCLVNNFIFLDYCNNGIHTNKYARFIEENSGLKFNIQCYMSFTKFQYLYKKICDGSFSIPLKYRIRNFKFELQEKERKKNKKRGAILIKRERFVIIPTLLEFVRKTYCVNGSSYENRLFVNLAFLPIKIIRSKYDAFSKKIKFLSLVIYDSKTF